MNDIYQTPTSNLDTDTKHQNMFRDLQKEQSFLATFLVTCFAGVPAFLITYSLIHFDISAFIIPGLLVGLAIKFFARSYELKYRIMSAILTALPFLIAMLVLPSSPFYFNISMQVDMRSLLPILFLAALSNAAIILFVGKRLLNDDERKAIYLHNIKRK